MSKHKIRSIVVGLPVVALCVALTLPVLAAPLSGPVAPGFFARIWQSVTGLAPGLAPPGDEVDSAGLERAAGAIGRWDPNSSNLELLDPTFAEEDSKSLSAEEEPTAEETSAGSDP